MKITTLVESQLAPDHRGLEAEFGLSLLIEHAGQRILFDTGAAGAAMRNAPHLGVNLRQVDAVVLSHHHFDHGGGLPAFFAIKSHAKVYLRHRRRARNSSVPCCWSACRRDITRNRVTLRDLHIIDVKGWHLIQRCRLSHFSKIARRKTIVLKRNSPDMHD